MQMICNKDLPVSRNQPVKTPTTIATAKTDRDLAEALRTHGLRASKQRLAILKALQKTPCPAAAEEVFRALPAKTCDLATLYRNLSQWEKLGLLRRMQLGDGASRFELVEPHHHHHHIVCRKCRRVEHIHLCGMDQIETRLRKKGFRDLSHSLEFFGLCSSC